MEYRFLSDTGIKISRLCFGTMSFGGDADEKTSAAMFRFCREKGINFFDCADVYQKGEAERILSSLIKEERDELVICSKVYFPTGDDVNARGNSRKHIMQAVEGSLRRLSTDYIDIYFLHRFDEYTALEETLRALDDCVRQGKILYSGASNFAAWQIAKALGISSKEGWNPFKCVQPMYNLVKRQAEVEIFPMAASENLAVIPYSPLGAGLLAGKYVEGKKPKAGRLLKNEAYKIRYGLHWMRETSGKFTRFAEENNFDPVSLAVAWAGSHPAVTAPIIGARNVSQLKSSVFSLEIPMTSDLRGAVTSLSPDPPPATDRNEEGTSSVFAER